MLWTSVVSVHGAKADVARDSVCLPAAPLPVPGERRAGALRATLGQPRPAARACCDYTAEDPEHAGPPISAEAGVDGGAWFCAGGSRKAFWDRAASVKPRAGSAG